MIGCTLKLRLNVSQERTLETWLWNLTGAYNWALRKIELDAEDGIYYSRFDLHALINGHGKKIGVPGHVLRATVDSVHHSWQRYWLGLSGKPKLKGERNRLRYISFPDPIVLSGNGKVNLPRLSGLRFHKQNVPSGQIKCARIIRRASGWYLCLAIDADSPAIPTTANGLLGIDPGFKQLLALSNGVLIDHPRELEVGADRLAQSHRARNRKQAARIQERIANQRKDRNHKLSRRLVEENQVIAFSKDNVKGLAKLFGKSVASSSHYQLRSMLAYKCRAGGRQYIEVPSRNSTKTCSACGSLSGPTGYAGLKVRHWQCDACGADHDRDINAAINTLIVGLGLSHERYREIASENLDFVGGSFSLVSGVGRC